MPLWGAAAGLGLRLARKHGGRLLRRIGGGSARRGAGRLGTGVVGATGVVATFPRGGGYRPPPPPGRPVPQGPIRRGIQRIAPGGRTGRELTPYGDMVSKQGLPLMVYPDTRERVEAPKGYVIVTHPVTGEKLAMLRGAAQRAGLFSPRPKPPISAGDAQAIRRAARAQRRVKKLATNVGYSCTPKGGSGKFGKRKSRK